MVLSSSLIPQDLPPIALLVSFFLSTVGTALALAPGWQPWLFSALSSFPCVLYFVIVQRGKSVTVFGRTPGRKPAVYLPLLLFSIASLLAGPDISMQERLGLLPSIVVFCNIIFWILHDVLLTRTAPSTSTSLRVGKVFPHHWQLFNMAGEAVQSQALSKQAKYTMLVLLRGGWCPFCRQQMRELIKRRVAFQEIGCQVCFITPLNISDDVKLPRKLPRGFMLLQDRGLAMSTSLGLTGVNRTMMLAKIPQMTIIPSVAIVNADWRIVYLAVALDYRVRPDPVQLLAAIKADMNDSQKSSGSEEDKTSSTGSEGFLGDAAEPDSSTTAAVAIKADTKTQTSALKRRKTGLKSVLKTFKRLGSGSNPKKSKNLS